MHLEMCLDMCMELLAIVPARLPTHPYEVQAHVHDVPGHGLLSCSWGLISTMRSTLVGEHCGRAFLKATFWAWCVLLILLKQVWL